MDLFAEFWNNITAQTANTVEWFQSIGYAVAGALGNFLYIPFREIIGFIAALGYILYVIAQFIGIILQPIYSLVTFLTGFIIAVGQNYNVAASGWDLATVPAINFFLSIPGYTNFVLIINAVVAWLVCTKIIKLMRYV